MVRANSHVKSSRGVIAISYYNFIIVITNSHVVVNVAIVFVVATYATLLKTVVF